MEEKQIDKKISFKQLIRISWFSFKLYIKPDKFSGIFLFILSIFSRLTAMIDFLIIAKIIDVVVEILKTKGDVSAVVPYFIVLVGFNFIAGLVNRSRWYFSNKVSRYFNFYSDIYIHEYYKTLGVPVMEDPEKNNVINRSKKEMHQLSSLFFIIIDIVADIVNIIITGITIFYFMPKIVLVVAIWVLIRNIPEIGFVKQLYQHSFKNTEKLRLNNHILDYILNKITLIELSIHNATDYFKDRYSNFARGFLNEWSWIRKKMYWWNTGYSFLNMFLYFWIMMNIVGKILRDSLSVGRLYFYISMVERFERNVNVLFTDVVALYEKALRIDDTYQFFNLKPGFSDGSVKLDETNKEIKACLSDVWFKYPNTNKFVLRGVDLCIKPGEKIAIVGNNGAGKTTLIKLILRFYQTTRGSIKINGTDIDDLKIDSYYKHVGTLFQDFGHYGALTVSENIFLGNVNDKFNLKFAKESAEKADVDEFVRKYPNKYSQILSESYTEGIRPSTGQWQRLAISRLFYRNPWLVIFDEPTASIDAEAEYKIFNNIYKFFENKTVIIISHRFSTVRNADRIILIDDGKIAEQGSHDELLALGGRYAKAFKLQAEGYGVSKNDEQNDGF